MDGDKIVTADVTYSPSMIADAMKLTAEARSKGTAMPALAKARMLRGAEPASSYS
mgnify:CR=1 FL=1